MRGVVVALEESELQMAVMRARRRRLVGVEHGRGRQRLRAVTRRCSHLDALLVRTAAARGARAGFLIVRL